MPAVRRSNRSNMKTASGNHSIPKVPDIRIKKANRADADARGSYVLYWMTAYRRVEYNYSLQRAAEWCRELKKPLLILEALRCGYQWASRRFHRFIIQGMLDNASDLESKNVLYYPYLEPEHGSGKGLLDSLSKDACVVVTDDFPCFFMPRMIRAASGMIPVAFEVTDSNGILPIRAGTQEFKTAYSFRRFLQKVLPSHLHDLPLKNPLKEIPSLSKPSLSREVSTRWPAVPVGDLKLAAADPSSFPVDHRVGDALYSGGRKAGLDRMHGFLENGLALYTDRRNQPELDGTSGFSPYLHFGHISVHEVLKGIMEKESWFFDRLGTEVRGKKNGWWGMSKASEDFLDELVTWRELGFNMCRLREDYDRYESLPDWARNTLYHHRLDKRTYIYSPDEFESGATHDPLWNAAQMQLVREGRIHNYLRMLWGKKVLEWSASPRDALDTMIMLNNKYAVDGRDPNSYSGIFWTLGRYDRAWGPERRIFGKIRYMSSENTARKVGVKRYLSWYAP